MTQYRVRMTPIFITLKNRGSTRINTHKIIAYHEENHLKLRIEGSNIIYESNETVEAFETRLNKLFHDNQFNDKMNKVLNDKG